MADRKKQRRGLNRSTEHVYKCNSTVWTWLLCGVEIICSCYSINTFIIYHRRSTRIKGREELGWSSIFRITWLQFVHAGTGHCTKDTHTGQKVFSCCRPAASSRSLDPRGHLCCLTRSPPRNPAAPAAAPSPSLPSLTLNYEEHKYLFCNSLNTKNPNN